MKLLQTPALACAIASACAAFAPGHAQLPKPSGEVREFLQDVVETIPVRVEHRATMFETLATTTPEDVEHRLDNLEEDVLLFIAEMNPDEVAQVVNSFGAAMSAFIATYPNFGEHLTDDQIETIVAAAIWATTLTPEDVEAMLKKAERFAIPALFNAIEGQSEEIALLINEIGYKALDLQSEFQSQAQEKWENFTPPEMPSVMKPCFRRPGQPAC